MQTHKLIKNVKVEKELLGLDQSKFIILMASMLFLFLICNKFIGGIYGILLSIYSLIFLMYMILGKDKDINYLNNYQVLILILEVAVIGKQNKIRKSKNKDK